MKTAAHKGGVNLLLAFAMAAAVLYAVWVFFGHLQGKPVIRIGVLHSLTGTMATSEAPLVDAVRLAVEEVNQSGGIGGAQVEIVLEDCRSDAGFCAKQAEKLITQDKVRALFGCWTSACRKAVKPVVEKYNHLLFYPVQYEGLEQSPNIIYAGAAPNQQLIPMVNWALQQRGKRVYLIGSDYVFPRTANGIVRKQLHVQGGEAVAEHYVPLGEQNLDAVARDIAAKHPDFVLNTLNGDSNRYFFRALKNAGIRAADIPVFSTSIGEADLAAIGPGSVAGHYAAWNYFQSLDSDANRAFVERFHRRFGADKVLDDPMESAYIAVKLWAHAADSGGTLDVASVRTSLGVASLHAPEGIVAVDSDTMHLWKTARIGRARADGQFDIVWESPRNIDPAPFPYILSYEERMALVKGAQ